MLAGTTRQRGRVALFDLSRPGAQPITNVQLKQKCKPLVSAIEPQLSVDSEEEEMAAAAWGFLAAVGYYGTAADLVCSLYDFRARRACSSFSSCPKKNSNSNSSSTGGTGVTQLLWSTNNNFLFVFQRQSTCVTVLDTRMGLAHVATLKGYKGVTNQRLSASIASFQQSKFLLTGSTDGTVCRYDDKALMGMDCEAPMDSWLAHDPATAVSSVAVNPISNRNNDTPVVIATASGQRLTRHDNGDPRETECSLKIWSL